ncbi:MAG: YifB family Mg chelatase-like AAA ATPase [Patescibacteria group bacterium]|nr:YifB family Mg chelatase-like AAA ATPase [Patescibacteria group bacterium]MDE2172681.1 YifB family Mg chelatase-like AAA ATPase [Patescibacteria group bacterium]
MSLARAYSAQIIGLTSIVVIVEVDISNGLHAFSIVGLGDRSVEEAKDRVAAAVKNSGYISPKQKNQKVVVSLAPADMRKEGSSFDLSIALAYLRAAGDIEFDVDGRLFIGELSLEGRIRHVAGLLPILCQAAAQGFVEAYIPRENAAEASLARGIEVYPVSSLEEVISHLSGGRRIEPIVHGFMQASQRTPIVDMKTIRGNLAAKRGLEIAAAGAHNVVMCGMPGTGKSMLAQGFSSILPPLSYEQAVEVTGIHSVARTLGDALITEPPFRAPHHTASYPSIVGGGSVPRPGEISLAHRGVLFLDEFPEFDQSVIDALRQPLEERAITISRAKGSVTFPAQCILVAAMNPCPCGRGPSHGCRCPQHILKLYERRLSGPIIDRIDIWVDVDSVDYDELASTVSTAEPSSAIRERVRRARDIQAARFAAHGSTKVYNAEMNADDIEKIVSLDDDTRQTLLHAAKALELSGRAFHRIIKVACTVADLCGRGRVARQDILEALQYRRRPIRAISGSPSADGHA